ITKQADADALPTITDTYPFKDLNKAVVHVNTQFADGYNGKKPAHQGGHGH
ncbi:MAG: carbonic anhydrase, partial [Nitrospirae bacterium]|nr:carbonic anhydrase [Nitrospirota bacterium]